MSNLLTAVFPVVILMAMETSSSAGSRDALWKAVDAAIQKGLPKTAVEQLGPIIAGAIQDRAYAEAIKALGKRISLEGIIEGNKPEEKIARLQAELAKAPDEMKPMLEVILANWYWHYFQQNRYRFLQRTATAEAPSEDFTTWDLPRLFAEIDKHFALALASAEQLQKIPVAEYDDLLQKGSMPDSYRPTLFDFVAHNALTFYTAAEQAAAQPQDAFEIAADGPIFGTVAEFTDWTPQTTDQDSAKLKAVRLYQQLLKFHQHDEDPVAWLDVDLSRLVFGHNTAYGETKSVRFRAALQRFAEKWNEFDISARARYHWAESLREANELVPAREIAQQGQHQFPDSVGGRMCFNLVQQIEAREASIQTERVWNAPWPDITVLYRNVTKVYFRIVASDFEALLKSGRGHPESLDNNRRAELLQRAPVLSWSANLPATDDFQTQMHRVPVPQTLPPGFYFLVASHTANFEERDNQISYAAVWVSQLALVTRTRNGSNSLEGFVLDANTGTPLAEARVRTWYRNNRSAWKEARPTTTDNNGLFRIPGLERQQVLLLASQGDQELAAQQAYYTRSFDNAPRPFERTVFFTDRALYRPGQTVHYKGICIQVDQSRDNYRTLSGRSLVVTFRDVNGQEVARQQHRTNDYGSFSGSFATPRDRLMGRMSIRVEKELPGQTFFRVEEYKRPKFQVVLDAPDTSAKLNESVSLVGKVTAYTGAAVDGAQVRWRVVRQVQYPPWWYWRSRWYPPRPQESQEIARGTAITAADGSFPVEFTAQPDRDVSPDSEPTFQFMISADVTDTTGETRSARRTVNVGYTALSASLTADKFLTAAEPITVRIHTTTLDGEGQQAEGSLKLYAVRQPEKVTRPSLSGPYQPRRRRGAAGASEPPPPDPTDPNSWPLGDLVAEEGFTSDTAGNASFTFRGNGGLYRLKLHTQDRFGKTVTAELPLRVLDPDSNQLTIKVPNLVDAPTWTLEPGQELAALWGSGYEQARAFVEVEHRGKTLQSYWTDPDRTQVRIRQQVTESMRGGFTVRVTMVRENRAYLEQRQVSVPWSNKELAIRWEHFVSKLEPGQRETWTAVVSGPDAKRAVAEMVATLYDQSLDAYLPHGWPSTFGVFRQDRSLVSMRFENALRNLRVIQQDWNLAQQNVALTYRAFPSEIIENLWGFQYQRRARGRAMFGAPGASPPAPGMPGMGGGGAPQTAAAAADGMMENAAPARRQLGGVAELAKAAAEGEALDSGASAAPQPDLSQVAARANLDETAFFFPHLMADKQGQVRIEFTMPEALTKWKFLGFAHDTELRSGLLTDSIVTAKDLMVQPNPPRFLREGDVLEFSVKVTNQSAARQTGSVQLTLADARTGQNVDQALGNVDSKLPFDIPSKESRSYYWRLTVPDGMGFLTYKAVGSTGRLADGEEGYLPVLSRRILVTESLPLPIRGPGSKEFQFTKLLESGQSDTLRHQSLTVQMVSNPVWYAVMALPYLMEYPYECSEQVFNRLYANALARHIANSDPKIRRVFDLWNSPLPANPGAPAQPALDSPLEKNQDLKAVMLEETPWVRQAESESQARRNVGILFDANRLNSESAATLGKLGEMQLEGGLWPWFPGGRPNEYITLYITAGFGRLRHLGVDIPVEPAVKSLAALDGWIERIYREIVRQGNKDKVNVSHLIAFYLYGRSFFLDDQPIAAEHREAMDYFLDQARQHWLKLACRQSQAHLAIALKRFGDKQTPQDIMRSLKERSVSSEELGMFWRDTELSWWWYRAPIEAQAMMIEAFDEVMGDAQAVEDCRVWLLKQKQTQDWKTTKATADAVYGLLLRGTNLLASDQLVEVTLGDMKIQPERVEAGTGFYEQRFAGPEIQPALGRVTVKKVDPGVAWGSLHWQYLEDMRKVTPYEGTPLKLEKKLFVKELTDQGPVLKPVTKSLAVGNELVVRIVLRTDRDMEYMHLKDQRGSGTEPVNVLSRYKIQDGLYYYESTRDTASHFFIDYLPKGTYVFEYSVRVQHRGQYQTGMAQIQCMYAPEFNSHSESFTLEVR